jgi:proteasome accessory factor A
MKKVLQGTEHEYTFYSTKLQDAGVDAHRIGLEILHKSSLHLAGEFLKNGSRAYWDVGHLEISTCETSNFWDLLIWEKAGEKIIDWVRKIIEEEHMRPGERLLALKNNTAPDGTSYGSHENYMVSRDLDFPEDFERCLAPHLTTRLIFTGAGDILQDHYVLSPSAFLTSVMVSDNTMSGTGVLNTRDETHGDSARFRRLHLQIGDALLNEVAILLRNFTTSAVLALMEMNALKDAPKLASPVEDMWHNVEQTNPDKWQVHLEGGKVVSPIEIQRYYLAKVESEGIVKDAHEKKAFRFWEEVLDGLEKKKSKEMARKVEWLDRYFAIQEQAKLQPDDPEVEMRAAKGYSEVALGRGLHYKRMREGLIDRVLKDEDIIKAITEPPQDTRAKLRRRLCDRYEGNIFSVDWSSVIVNEKDGGIRKIDMPDPLATELEG